MFLQAPKQSQSNAKPAANRTMAVQPKLEVGKPGDRHEQEADAVADQVMQMFEPTVQRKCAGCEIEEKLQRQPVENEEEELQMKPLSAGVSTVPPQLNRKTKNWLQMQTDQSAGTSVESTINKKRGTGKTLPSNTRNFMESRIGANFKNVNIHTDSQATEMNQALGARAFTVGSDIFFNKGQWKPESSEGKQLLAHELTHTIQQGGATKMVQPAEADAPNRPDVEERYMLGIGGYSNLYDAELNRRIRTLTLKMRVKFNYSNAILPWPSDAAKQTWQNSFIKQVENRWSYRYYIISRTSCTSEPSNVYYARINIIPVTSNPHYTMNIRYNTNFQGSAVHRSARWARMDALDTSQRTDIPQTPVEHEFGHMIGLPHIHCDSNAKHCYGVTAEEQADVMGLGSNVGAADYTPFTSSMYFFTGCNWIASHTLPENR